MPRKNYKKPAQEIFEYSQKNRDTITEEDVYNMMTEAFSITEHENESTDYSVSKIYTKARAKPLENLSSLSQSKYLKQFKLVKHMLS